MLSVTSPVIATQAYTALPQWVVARSTLFLSPDPLTITVRPMKNRARLFSLSALLVSLSTPLGLGLLAGCDQKGTQGGGEKELSAEADAAKKKATVDALLRESGIDPNTLPTGPKADKTGAAAPPTQGASGQTDDGPANPDANGGAPVPPAAPMKIEVLDAGKGPKKVLRYVFTKDRLRKFNLDMEIVPKRVVNGQPTPTVPAVSIGMKGTSLTVAVGENSAETENTFIQFVPSGPGLPVEMLQQMQAQFATMAGVQLMQTVSTGGQILQMGVKEEALNNPQVLALMQNLQDGMSNAFLPLPDEPVGAGAKWKGTTTLVTSGLAILQENVIELKSLTGSRAVVELTYKQSAEKQEINAAGLPPGAKVELISMEGGGTGTMTVDFSTQLTDSMVNLKMTVDTKISGPEMPESVRSATDTSMKIHMRITE